MQLPKHIMIVEDEAITQRYLKDILTHYGVESIECHDNAQDAYLSLKDSACEMILMDINIKGSVDGIQLARKILQQRTIPIVFITAHSDQDTFQEVLDLSPYGFIAKPFSAKDVEMTLQVAYKRFLVQKDKEVMVDKDEDLIRIDHQYVYSKSLKRLYKNDEEVVLNNKHLKLVDKLCCNINHTVDYESLKWEIWQSEEIAESALRTLVYTLRKQLPDLPLVSYSKIGYSIKTGK
jgi:DNA-binding response OmpR family regulator